MSDLLTPLSDLLQTQLEVSRRISDAFFSGAGKLDHAMLDVTHQALDEQLRFAQAIGNTRDPQTFSNLQSTYWASKPDEVQIFQKKMVQIITEMQNELGRATQSYIEQMSVRGMRGMSPGVFATGDRAASAGMSPFDNMMSVWGNTMRGMSSMADQAISTARTGAARAGVAAAQTGAQALSEATTALTDQASHDQDVEDAESDDDGIVDEHHEAGRHQNGVESHGDQKRSGQPRRK